MDSKRNASAILMSIHPKYVDRIMGGEKKVEFRKVAFGREISYAVIYATSPEKRIVGLFQVSFIDNDSPACLWKRYNRVAGICSADFFEYYSSVNQGVAINIGNVWKLKNPMPLNSLPSGIAVPQSFAYLDPSVFNRLRNKAIPIGG